MDKLKKYRRILREITESHAQMSSPMNWVHSTAASDFAGNNFFLIDFDSNDKKHYIVFHLRLDNGKVFVVQDGIEYGIANDLIDAGISASDVVSPFFEENKNRELLAA